MKWAYIFRKYSRISNTSNPWAEKFDAEHP